ncbi:hypothetical protein OWM07_07065 [Deferribacter thermophilus]|uniref:hypothetical protein n=1 Tax=Deferribacter thermophilus TaxID=53573 RepID=UPI003C189058
MKQMILLILSGLLTIFITLFFAVKYFDGKIVEEPYYTGLDYDKNKNLINKYNFDIIVNKMTKKGEICSVDFSINGDTEFYLKDLNINYTVENGSIELEKNFKGNSGVVGFECVDNRYYILKAIVELKDHNLTLEKVLYVK